MNFEKVTTLHKSLKERLGNDLVYSLALDSGKFYLAVSVHKSETQEFDHGRNIQSCLISESEFDKPIEQLVDELAEMYATILVEKENV